MNFKLALRRRDDLQCFRFQQITSTGGHFPGFHFEERILDEQTFSDGAFVCGFALDGRRLEIVEINARKRLRDVQFARLAIQPDAVPIEYPVSGVRVLLDFKNHQAGADGVDAAAGQEHRVARAHGNAMETFRHFAGPDFFLKFRARDTAFESDEQFRVRRGGGDEPHFGLRFAAEFGGFVRRRMDLERKLFARIENLAEQRKTILICRFCVAEQFGTLIFHQPAQIFPGQRAVGDDADVTRPVADFP